MSLVAYADDIAMIAHSNDIRQLNHIVAMAADAIGNWMEANELQLAPEKTECVILKGNGKRDELAIDILGIRIEPSRKLKYLGVVFGQGMTFGQHIKYVTDKAETRVSSLMRITRNIGGPSSHKRKLLYGVIQSTILYAAPVWAEWTKYKRYANMLIGTQRKALLRVAMAYRTTSAKAIQVIAGVPPINMLIMERKRLNDRADGHTDLAKREEREVTYREWQLQWVTQGTTGEWTRTLIKNVKSWTECIFRRTDYYLTQILSGHGTFGSYTKKIKKTEVDKCIYCEESDDPRHTIFECVRWTVQRMQVELKVGEEINENRIVDIMLTSKDRWDAVHSYIKEIMNTKENDDKEIRRRQ